MVECILPWTDILLQRVQEEYRNPPPTFQEVGPSDSDIQYVTQLCKKKDSFDTLQLKYDFYKRLQKNTAIIHKTTSSHGDILLLTFQNDSYNPPWKTWWRAIRLLSPNPVRVVIFAHPKKRLPPPHGNPLTEEHVNGGMTQRCNEKTVIVYRKEEATRVLIHELFHANCSDPYTLPIPHLEADTEAWAELVLCAMIAKGDPIEWKKQLDYQVKYALTQANSAKTYHDVEDADDYAWRYLTGRLDVWRHLGLNFPMKLPSIEKVKSLRFTALEPENV